MMRRNYLITMIGTVDTGKLERFMVMTELRSSAIGIARECADKQHSVEGFKVSHRTRQSNEWRMFAQQFKPFN